MATIAKSAAGLAGSAIAFAAASAGGDVFVNDGSVRLLVKNADSSSKTVTVDSTGLCSMGFDHNLVIVVAAGDTEVIGPFPVARFGRSVAVTYSAVTSVTVAVTG